MDDKVTIKHGENYSASINVREFVEISKELSKDESHLIFLCFSYLSSYCCILMDENEAYVTKSLLFEKSGISKEKFEKSIRKLLKMHIIKVTENEEILFNPFLGYSGDILHVGIIRMFENYEVRIKNKSPLWKFNGEWLESEGFDFNKRYKYAETED